jgi:plasmid stabilization system protein ParE
MTFEAVFLRKAQHDLDLIVEYLARHSPAGARNWLTALEAAVDLLERDPHQYALAPESDAVSYIVRNIPFKTRKGRRYRLVYTVVDTQVRVLRILGPGHDLLAADDF